jgi:hypothetical protein
VAEFKYLGMRVTNQNFIQEEIKRRWNFGNATIQSRTFVFSSAVQKHKNQNIQNYYSACDSVWV